MRQADQLWGREPGLADAPRRTKDVMVANWLGLAHQYDPGEEIVPKPPVIAGEA